MLTTYISVILTLLTLITGVLAIISFVNGRKKDSNADSKRSGAMEQQINSIAHTAEEIQRDVRELRERDRLTSELAIAVQESVKSAHKRIDGLEKRIDK